MDKQYIKMCDALEIQGQWLEKYGDKLFSKSDGHSFIISGRLTSGLRREDFIWLPRQEDIQEMFVRVGRNSMPNLIRGLNFYLNDGKFDYGKSTGSKDMNNY